MKEEWRDIVGYEGCYQVSTLGRVKSLERFVKHKDGGKRRQYGRILKGMNNGNGYLSLRLSKLGLTRQFLVHKLVAMAFLGYIPNGHKIICDHINNIKTDNRLGNLQIITARENASKDRVNGSSEYIGVSWWNQQSSWVAAIQIKGKNKFLGAYKNELDAASAYQKALKEIS